MITTQRSRLGKDLGSQALVLSDGRGHRIKVVLPEAGTLPLARCQRQPSILQTRDPARRHSTADNSEHGRVPQPWTVAVLPGVELVRDSEQHLVRSGEDFQDRILHSDTHRRVVAHHRSGRGADDLDATDDHVGSLRKLRPSWARQVAKCREAVFSALKVLISTVARGNEEYRRGPRSGEVAGEGHGVRVTISHSAASIRERPSARVRSASIWAASAGVIRCRSRSLRRWRSSCCGGRGPSGGLFPWARAVRVPQSLASGR